MDHSSSPHPLPDPVLADPDLMQGLANWLELRLHETAGWISGSRLFGLTVLDADGVGRNADDAVRLTFLADGHVYALLDSPTAMVATLFDALGLCCYGTATKLDSGEQHRCRTVLVANQYGQATSNRMEGSTPEPMGRASGPVAERVDALFDVFRSADGQRRA